MATGSTGPVFNGRKNYSRGAAVLDGRPGDEQAPLGRQSGDAPRGRCLANAQRKAEPLQPPPPPPRWVDG